MFMGSLDIMPRSGVWSIGVSVAGAHHIRSETAHIPHLLPVRITGNKDSRPSSTTRIEVRRQPTPSNRAEHLNRIKLDLPTSHLETMEVEFM